MSRFFKILLAPIIFIQTYFKTVVFLTIMFFILTSGEESSLEKPNLAKLELYGAIMDSSAFLEEVEKLKKDDSIKGVLVDVNSPGGAVAPSVEMAYAIKELKELKPVIAYASGVMASGSYYASIWADKIIANPGSMIGSIGVIFQSADASELLDKIGVKPQIIKAGTYKEVGTPTRQWNEYEQAELEKVLKDTYDMFVTDVADARGIEKKYYKLFADAHIFTARQAKSVKLIDEVGNITVAKNELIALSKVEKAIWRKPDEVDKFMDKFLNQASSKLSLAFTKQLSAY